MMTDQTLGLCRTYFSLFFKVGISLCTRPVDTLNLLAISWQYDDNISLVKVSKETVVLRRWGSSIQKFGFINGVDNVNWPPYRDSKS